MSVQPLSDEVHRVVPIIVGSGGLPGRGGRSVGQRPDGWLESLCQVGLVQLHVPCVAERVIC